MDKIMGIVNDILAFFKDFKLADLIEYIKGIFDKNVVQPR